eukprot:jgi/Chlat1/5468/Chrsp36S09005
MSAALSEYTFWSRWGWARASISRECGVCRAAAVVGITLVIGGECVRKAGMIAAGASFTHVIQHQKRPQHALVTHGVYKYIRHPGYAGWFYWAIGTQLLLCNPVCTIAFATVAWRFFAERIPYEEALLRNFFGRQYEEYAARTPTWIPFIA